jgi:hypothetical protein
MWWSATSIVVISLFTVSASLHTGREVTQGGRWHNLRTGKD